MKRLLLHILILIPFFASSQSLQTEINGDSSLIKLFNSALDSTMFGIASDGSIIIGGIRDYGHIDRDSMLSLSGNVPDKTKCFNTDCEKNFTYKATRGLWYAEGVSIDFNDTGAVDSLGLADNVTFNEYVVVLDTSGNYVTTMRCGKCYIRVNDAINDITPNDFLVPSSTIGIAEFGCTTGCSDAFAIALDYYTAGEGTVLLLCLIGLNTEVY